MKGAEEEVCLGQLSATERVLALRRQRCIPQHTLLFTQRGAFFSHAARGRQREAVPHITPERLSPAKAWEWAGPGCVGSGTEWHFLCRVGPSAAYQASCGREDALPAA